MDVVVCKTRDDLLASYKRAVKLYADAELSCRGLLGDDFRQAWKEMERLRRRAEMPMMLYWRISVSTAANSTPIFISHDARDSLSLCGVLALAEFRTVGIDFISSQEAFDTRSMGKAMFTIIGAMAELERNVIRERIVAGLEHARVHGTKSGAAVGRPHAVFDRAAVVELRAAGRSWREIATELSVSVRSVRRVYAQGVAKPSPQETRIGDATKRVAGA